MKQHEPELVSSKPELSPSTGRRCCPELEHLPRVLQAGIVVGRVGRAPPALPGEYWSQLQSPRLLSLGSPCSAELCTAPESAWICGGLAAASTVSLH